MSDEAEVPRAKLARWVRALEVRRVAEDWPALRAMLADMRRVGGLGERPARTRVQWVDSIGWYWRRW